MPFVVSSAAMVTFSVAGVADSVRVAVMSSAEARSLESAAVELTAVPSWVGVPKVSAVLLLVSDPTL